MGRERGSERMAHEGYYLGYLAPRIIRCIQLETYIVEEGGMIKSMVLVVGGAQYQGCPRRRGEIC